MGNTLKEAVGEYTRLIEEGSAAFERIVLEAEKGLREAVTSQTLEDVAAPQEETVSIEASRLAQLETIAEMVAKNPELFNQAKV